MKKIIKKLTLAMAILASTVLMGVVLPATAMATPKDDVCSGVELASPGGGGCNDGDLAGVAKVVINIMSWAVGIVAVIMIIIAGFSFVTSGGDPQKAAKARMTILYAIIGIVVVVMAQVIVRFVLTKI